MLIHDLACAIDGRRRILSAAVIWEERDFPAQRLTFDIDEPQGGGEWTEFGADPLLCEDPVPDAFLAACFPLAAVHGETRVRVEGRACPMLVEGLRTAYAWWSSWGGMPNPAPRIETAARGHFSRPDAPRRAVALLSGGVDSLHMLMRNHQLYDPDDAAYIRDAIFIHGIDIGKRARDAGTERYQAVLRRLEPVAIETGIRLIPCRTNLRHLPSRPGFWANRHSGAALAAVGHAATLGPGFLFIGGTYQVATPVPVGSHPTVDGLFSSQRLTVIHDGSRFSRLEKVRELATWPTALRVLRVCPESAGDEVNCGRCEKCLRTRLELLAAGVDETASLGPSLTPVELWNEAVPVPINHRAITYHDLLSPLRARGFDSLCEVLESKIADYREASGSEAGWVAD
ncbi:MAG: hypothetical protein WB611_30415 [Stellaceae bacterium]